VRRNAKPNAPQGVNSGTTGEQTMDLHGQIMNLACVPANMDAEPNQRLAYKVGHRDARHAAAELALKADACIDALRAALIELRDRIKDHPAYADLTVEEEICQGGDTAEFSYLARVADAALGA